MAEKNEVAKKPEFTTGLSQWTNTITGLVSRDFEQNGVQYDEYSKQCAMNAMGAIFQLVQKSNMTWPDDSDLDIMKVFNPELREFVIMMANGFGLFPRPVSSATMATTTVTGFAQFVSSPLQSLNLRNSTNVR